MLMLNKCPWCAELNFGNRPNCKCCGHETHKSRIECECLQCFVRKQTDSSRNRSYVEPGIEERNAILQDHGTTVVKAAGI